MPLKMKQLPESERPYEKLEMYGPNMLSNAELLAIIIKTGTKEETSIDISRKILVLNQSENTKEDNLSFMQHISLEEFMKIKGIGKVKAIQLKAVCELAKRMSRPIKNLNITVKRSKDVADLLMEELQYEKRELVKIVILDTKNKIGKILDISYGGTNFAMIEPKEIIIEVVKMGAPKIIMVHNHPSGDPAPSQSDIEVTKRMIQATQIIGIELLDHIVIGNHRYQSIFSKIYGDEKGSNGII